jgi:hypothetical protein
MVAGRDRSDEFSDRLDDSSSLVTQQEREVWLILAFEIVQVAMAEARCEGPDENLMTSRLVDLDIDDLQ